MNRQLKPKTLLTERKKDKKFSKQEITTIAEIYESKAGNVAATCKATQMSRTKWYEMMKLDDEFRQAIKDVDAGLIDYAESTLYKNLRDGKETSLIFFLKNKRPDEWKDRKDFDVTNKMKLIVLDDEEE